MNCYGIKKFGLTSAAMGLHLTQRYNWSVPPNTEM